MKRTIIVCTLVLSCSVLVAAQGQKKKEKPCKKCAAEAVQLVEKMKSANITLKAAVEAGEDRCNGTAVLAEVAFSDDGQQPVFSIYCSLSDGRLQIVDVTHEGKPSGMDPAIDLPSIHDPELHKPDPPKPGA